MMQARNVRTTTTGFAETLNAAIVGNNSRLVLPLDPDPGYMAHPHLPSFFTDIIEETKDLVCAYKPNLAFFEALGLSGMQTMLESLRAVPKHIPIIADAKRGDIGNTARFYAKALFDVYKFDACTVNPYGGRDAVEPFTAYADRGVFVWCRSSNPGAADVQDLELAGGKLSSKRSPSGRATGTSAATWRWWPGRPGPETRSSALRRDLPGTPVISARCGAQQGALEAAVHAAIDANGGGFLINASRGVTYASRGDDYAAAARKEAQRLRNRINVMREAALARG